MAKATDDIPQQSLRAANERLKAAKVPVRVVARGNRLSLYADMPPAPGSAKPEAHRQKLSLPNVRFTNRGVHQAESRAHALNEQLLSGAFRWEDWRGGKSKPEPLPDSPRLGECAKRLEREYFAATARTPITEATWKSEFAKVFNKLPSDAFVTEEFLLSTILAVSAGSRERPRTVCAMRRLAQMLRLQTSFDFSQLRGSYKSGEIDPDELPKDGAVETWRATIENPGWRWCFGAIATYGLRPHEVFRLDFDRLRRGECIARIKKSKTGFRHAWPLHPDWFEQFSLADVQLPGVSLQQTNLTLGHRVGVQFARYKIPFIAYFLRHAYAVRGLLLGIDIGQMALMMGHSVDVHKRTYLRAVGEVHHRQAYENYLRRKGTL